MLSRLGEYIDFFLQPLVATNKSYLKDSRDPITSLKKLPHKENDILATIEVNLLYTNIKQKDGLEVVKWAL